MRCVLERWNIWNMELWYEFNQNEWNIFRQNLNELEIVMVPVSCAKPIKQSHYKIISTVKSVILDTHSNITICQIITKVHKSDCFRQGIFLIVTMSKNGSSLFLTQEGLTVVDVYTEWSGPCTAMQATLKRAKLEVAILWCRCCGVFMRVKQLLAAIMMSTW